MSTCLFETDSDAFLPNIAKLFQRTEKSLKEDIALLKEWMEKQPHLPEVMDEKIIQNFLIRSKFSIEKAKQRIDNYYTIRSEFPELFQGSNPEDEKMKKFRESMIWVPLPKAVDGFYKVLFWKIRNKELFEQTNAEEAFKHIFNTFEVRLLEDNMFGEIAVFDCEGISLKYVIKWTPMFLDKCFTVYEKVCSMTLKAIYFVNSPSFVDTVLVLLKTVLKPKIFQRIYVCQDSSILKERFSTRIIPKDYGGEEISLDEIQSLLESKFHQHKDRFDKLDKLRVDENLRPEKLENDENLGFYGSFKKLDID